MFTDRFGVESDQAYFFLLALLRFHHSLAKLILSLLRPRHFLWASRGWPYLSFSLVLTLLFPICWSLYSWFQSLPATSRNPKVNREKPPCTKVEENQLGKQDDHLITTSSKLEEGTFIKTCTKWPWTIAGRTRFGCLHKGSKESCYVIQSLTLDHLILFWLNVDAWFENVLKIEVL